MSVKIQRILNITMVLISLSTVPLMGLQNIKRFLPVSILIGLIEGVNAQIGKKRDGGSLIINQIHIFLMNFLLTLVCFW